MRERESEKESGQAQHHQSTAHSLQHHRHPKRLFSRKLFPRTTPTSHSHPALLKVATSIVWLPFCPLPRSPTSTPSPHSHGGRPTLPAQFTLPQSQIRALEMSQHCHAVSSATPCLRLPPWTSHGAFPPCIVCIIINTCFIYRFFLAFAARLLLAGTAAAGTDWLVDFYRERLGLKK